MLRQDTIEHHKEEVDCLQKYFGEGFINFKNCGQICGKFEIYVDLPPNFKVRVPSVEEKQGDNVLIAMKSMPPIILVFQLSCDYPSTQMPDYQLYCPWLTYDHKFALCRKLNDIWRQCIGDTILYSWYHFIKTYSMAAIEIEEILDLTDIYYSQAPNPYPVRRKNKGYGRHRIIETYRGESILDYVLKYGKPESIDSFVPDNFFGVTEHTGKPVVICLDERRMYPDRSKRKVFKCCMGCGETAVGPGTYEETWSVCNLCDFLFCFLCFENYHGVTYCQINIGDYPEIYQRISNGSEEVKKRAEKQFGQEQVSRIMSGDGIYPGFSVNV